MKKALIVLLTLALAGGLFAQDVSFSGHVATGMFIEFGDAHDETIVYADDDDANVPVRGQFNVAVDDGDWGVNLGLRGNIGADPFMSMNNAYGWLKFIDIIKVSAGLIDDGVWGTGGEIDSNFSTGGGVRVEVVPFDGLSLGAFFSYPDYGIAAAKVANFIQETAFGASYESDIFHASAALKLFSKESTVEAAHGKLAADDKTDIGALFAVGFNIIGIGILVDGAILGLGDYSNVGMMEIYEELDFGITNVLKVGLLLGEGLTGEDGFSWFKVKPWIEFGVTDALLLHADAGVTMEKANQYFGVGTAETSLGLATFFLNLNAKYTIGGGWVKVGYGFVNCMKDYGDSLDHYIKLIFGWDF